MKGNLSLLSFADFSFKLNFFKKYATLSNGLDPHQGRHSVDETKIGTDRLSLILFHINFIQ